MSTRANFTRGYLWRYLIIALLGIGWAIYGAYDGFYAYPKKLKYSKIFFEQLQEEGESIDDGERIRRWKELVADKVEKGDWPQYLLEQSEQSKYPEKEPGKIQNDIYFSIGTGALALLVGLPNLFLLLTNWRAWIELNGNQINTSWGQKFLISDIKKLKKHRWEKKGIAVVEYGSENQNQIFMLDDFKFDRKQVGEILKAIEAEIPVDQIEGGSPESTGAETEPDQVSAANGEE